MICNLFLGRTKIEVAVLDGVGIPVPHTKISYVDSFGRNQGWTDYLGKEIVFDFSFIYTLYGHW